ERGVVLALKGAGAADEVSAAWPTIRRCGVEAACLLSLTARPSTSESGLEIVPEMVERWSVATPQPAQSAESSQPPVEPIALVVALSRFPPALSPLTDIGLG